MTGFLVALGAAATLTMAPHAAGAESGRYLVKM